MKKQTLLAFILGSTLTLSLAFTQRKSETDKSLAKVNQIDGKYVFINCTPAVPYETAFEYTTRLSKMGCPSILEMAEVSIKSASKKGLPYDAIIVGDTKLDLAIKFK